MLDAAAKIHVMLAPTCVDLFAGAGGSTQGLKDAGFRVLAAVELDAACAATYQLNHPEVALIKADVRSVDPTRLGRKLGLRRGQLDLLKACPPCQGFSSLGNGRSDDERNDLVLEVVRFIEGLAPRVVVLENVPGLQHDRRLSEFEEALARLGYKTAAYVVNATDFGVPQSRRRFILVAASERLRTPLPADLKALLPKDFDCGPATVRDAFEALSAAGRANDPLMRYRRSSETVLERIRSIPPNGSRFHIPDALQLDCHKRLPRRNATSSYGRLRLDEPSPTMTTRCTTPACGSFIHPVEHRGITLREAACLQTFPVTYDFAGHYGDIERQIGNAVPVRLAEALGYTALALLKSVIKRRLGSSARPPAALEIG